MHIDNLHGQNHNLHQTSFHIFSATCSDHQRISDTGKIRLSISAEVASTFNGLRAFYHHLQGELLRRIEIVIKSTIVVYDITREL